MRVTVISVLSALAFSATAEIGEYAEGIAVVRREGRSLVTAVVPGTIQEIVVRPGDAVEAGQLLARLDDRAERAELERLEGEFDKRLIEVLRLPTDETRRQRLATLDGELERARLELAARAITAPHDGLIADVRARAGQAVATGDAVVSIEAREGGVEIVGLFPGHTRPLLEAEGGELILALEGFPDSRQRVQVRSVADEVVGPTEALRLLGRERAGAFELSGPVVVVSVDYEGDRIVTDDGEYRLYDGMQGTLEAKLRASTVLEHLIPGLRSLRRQRG
nr:biotin/lipoyl-binding protein [Pseudenhygromyxa sp. WMMC2535]